MNRRRPSSLGARPPLAAFFSRRGARRKADVDDLVRRHHRAFRSVDRFADSSVSHWLLTIGGNVLKISAAWRRGRRTAATHMACLTRLVTHTSMRSE